MTRSELLQVAQPILFNRDMVQAILEGKSATRRCVKTKSKNACGFYVTFRVSDNAFTGVYDYDECERQFDNPQTPPCRTGDILYIRETYRPLSNHPKAGFEYAADWSPKYFKNSKDPRACNGGKWIPSIHMPKKAARIFLKVTDVRVEHLHDMTLDDFLAEGVTLRPEAFNDPENAYQQAQRIFAEEIWDKTLKKTDRKYYSWDANPWVWAIEFERVYPDDIEVAE